jgi:hypothetical protein
MHATHRWIGAVLTAFLGAPGCDAPCNQLDLPSAAATIESGSGSPPAATGGSITDGSYVLTSVLDYNPNDGLVGESTLSLMVVAGGIIQSISLDFKGSLERTSASYRTSGTTITQTGTCGFSQQVTQGYSATPIGLTLLQDAPPLAFLFDRM